VFAVIRPRDLRTIRGRHDEHLALFVVQGHRLVEFRHGSLVRQNYIVALGSGKFVWANYRTRIYEKSSKFVRRKYVRVWRAIRRLYSYAQIIFANTFIANNRDEIMVAFFDQISGIHTPRFTVSFPSPWAILPFGYSRSLYKAIVTVPYSAWKIEASNNASEHKRALHVLAMCVAREKTRRTRPYEQKTPPNFTPIG